MPFQKPFERNYNSIDVAGIVVMSYTIDHRHYWIALMVCVIGSVISAIGERHVR